MKGLILKNEPANDILNGLKTVEMRGCRTNNRGTIGIIKSGTKQVWGTAELYDCVELTKELYEGAWKDKHRSNKTYEELLLIYPKPFAWLLKNAVKFEKPKPYNHKQGCVIWVNLDQNE